jgi:hypothetical protein
VAAGEFARDQAFAPAFGQAAAGRVEPGCFAAIALNNAGKWLT